LATDLPITQSMPLSLRLRTRRAAVRTAVSHRIAPSLGLSIRNPCRFRHYNDGNDTDLFDLGTLMLIFRAAGRRDQLKLSGIECAIDPLYRYVSIPIHAALRSNRRTTYSHPGERTGPGGVLPRDDIDVQHGGRTSPAPTSSLQSPYGRGCRAR
jgi:hypothetical protein